MKPFDLEAAQRGEPICDKYQRLAPAVAVKYIGMHCDDIVVFDGLRFYACVPSRLFMAPVESKE